MNLYPTLSLRLKSWYFLHLTALRSADRNCCQPLVEWRETKIGHLLVMWFARNPPQKKTWLALHFPLCIYYRALSCWLSVHSQARTFLSHSSCFCLKRLCWMFLTLWARVSQTILCISIPRWLRLTFWAHFTASCCCSSCRAVIKFLNMSSLDFFRFHASFAMTDMCLFESYS